MSEPKLLPDHDTVLRSFNNAFAPGEVKEEMCNLCGGDIPAGSHISLYFSDVNLADLPDEMEEEYVVVADGADPDNPTQRWFPHHAYCEDCQVTNLLLPHLGTTEALYELYTPVSNPLDEYGITDYALATQGVDWDPEEVLETVSGIPLDEFTARYTTGFKTVGHADIADFLYRNDINIRKLVDKNGDVRVTEDAKEALQQQFNKEALRDRYKS